jgi:hypothetical protein
MTAIIRQIASSQGQLFLVGETNDSIPADGAGLGMHCFSWQIAFVPQVVPNGRASYKQVPFRQWSFVHGFLSLQAMLLQGSFFSGCRAMGGFIWLNGS